MHSMGGTPVEPTPEQAQLDCITVGVVRIDRSGLVTQVNEAWRGFCRSYPEHPLARVDTGHNLLALCRSAGASSLQALCDGLSEVVTGVRDSFDCEDHCIVARHQRWFRLQARRGQGADAATVLTQIDVTQERLARARVRIHACVAESFIARRPLERSSQDLGRLLCDELAWDFSAVWCLEPASWTMRCVNLWMRPGLALESFESSTRAARLAPGAGLPGLAWKSHKPVWATACDTDPATLMPLSHGLQTGLPPSVLGVGFGSGFAVPVKYGDEVLAVIEVLGRSVHEADDVLLHLLETVGVQLAAAELRERAELRAEGAQAEADVAREELEAVLAHTPALVIAIDRSGDVRFVNRALLVEPTLETTGPAWCGYVPEIAKARVASALEIVFSGGAPQTLEAIVPEADGGKRWFTIYVAPMGGVGQIHGALLVSQDVTQMKHAEQELYGAQRLASIGTLAAGIAHEINTPIQFLGDSLDFLREASADLLALLAKLQGLRVLVEAGTAPEQLRDVIADCQRAEEQADLTYLHDNVPKAFDRCVDGLERVTSIVRSMKEFSHPSSDEMEAVDLNRAIAATLTVARNEYKYVAELEQDLGELPPVICHVNEINQVVLNIVVNAAHAIGDAIAGSEHKGVLTVKTRLSGEDVLISISDTGGGIPEHIRDHIFDPFFTTKEVGRGTGQGLAIAWTAVKDKHGGELSFETKVGHGTTFFIRLPIQGKRQGDRLSAENPIRR
jgi:PAS domain S-box-containing protein